MQEHFFFTIPSLTDGIGAALNEVMLPDISWDGLYWQDPFTPWDLTHAEMCKNFQLPDGRPILDVIKPNTYGMPEEECDLGIWYYNSRLDRTWPYSPRNAFCSTFPNAYEQAVQTFGPALAQDIANGCASLNVNDWDSALRETWDLPDTPFRFITKVYTDEYGYNADYYTGSDLSLCSSSVFKGIDKAAYQDWSWMGTHGCQSLKAWQIAFKLFGDAIGNPNLFEENYYWIEPLITTE